jgi:hypothetical protein
LDSEALFESLDRERRRCRLTRRAVCAQLGVSGATYCSWSYGRGISGDAIARIVKWLDADLREGRASIITSAQDRGSPALDAVHHLRITVVGPVLRERPVGPPPVRPSARQVGGTAVARYQHLYRRIIELSVNLDIALASLLPAGRRQRYARGFLSISPNAQAFVLA